MTQTGIVTGRKTEQNRGQGTAVRLLQVLVLDGSDTQTVQLIEQAGEESNPPNGTLVAIIPAGQSCKLGVAAEDGIPPVLGIGGKRIYSIDPETHEVIGEVRLDPDGRIALTGPRAVITLQPDGTVTADNGAASFSMSPAGVFNFIGASAVFDCPITAPEATIAGKVVSTHTHLDPQGGSVGPMV